MSIVFIDGSSVYNTNAELLWKYYSAHSYITYGTEYPRSTGKGYINVPSGGTPMCCSLHTETYGITFATIGFAFMMKPASSISSLSEGHYQEILAIVDGAYPNVDYTITLYSHYGQPVIKCTTTSSSFILKGTERVFKFYEWHYVELKIYFSTSGALSLSIDGELEIITRGAQTIPDPPTGQTEGILYQVRFNGGAQTNIVHCFTDIVVKGSAPHPVEWGDFVELGNCMVETLYPNADSTPRNFIPSGDTVHARCINKVNWKDDAKYLYATPPDGWFLYDMYTAPGSTYNGSGTVHAVETALLGSYSGTPTSAAGGIKTSTSTYVHPTHQSLETIQKVHSFIFELNPVTELPWTLPYISLYDYGIVAIGE